MNASQKRKLIWILVGIIILALVALVKTNYCSKDVSLSPSAIIIPPLWNLLPPIDRPLVRPSREGPRIQPVETWRDICDSSSNGFTRCTKKADRQYSQKCECSDNTCEWSTQKLCDNECKSGFNGGCKGEFEN